MPASSIAQILLRLFALKWFVQGIIQVVSYSSMGSFGEFALTYMVVPVVSVVGAIWLWFLAPVLARAMAKRNDGAFDLKRPRKNNLVSSGR